MLKNEGFTIIEVFVTVGTLILLSGIILTYNKTGERQLLFIKERSKFLDSVYRAKGLSVQTFANPEVPCGFGIYLEDSNHYILFGDLPNSSLDCSSADNIYTDINNDEFMERFELNSQIKFILDTGPTNIVFIPPDPITILNGDPSIENLELKIVTPDETSVSSIDISSSGQIQVR